jgi:hypothetical protein
MKEFNGQKKSTKVINRVWVVGGWALVCRAKLNVVFLYRLVSWQNTSFNFAKGRQSFCISVEILSGYSVALQ